MERKELIRNVFQAANEFNGRRLWQRFSNYDCFAVRMPDREESMLGVVLGDAGEQYGLTLFRGPKAAAGLAALLDSDGPGDDAIEAIGMLGFSMEPFGDLPPDAQDFVRQAGLHPRHKEQVPGFMVKPPGRHPRLPDESELTLLLMVLRGVVEADKDQLLHPAELDDQEGICVLTLSGDPRAPQVSVSREPWQPPDVAKTISFPSASPDLKGLPRLEATWLVGTPILPAGLQGDDRTLQILLVADEVSESILQARPIFAGETQGAVKALVDTFHGPGPSGHKGLPREIVFSSQTLHGAMKPVLEQAGVKCVYLAAIPKLHDIVAKLWGRLGHELPPLADDLEAPSGQEAKRPAPDDLARWKEVDRRLAERFTGYLQVDDRLWSSRAVKRYFDEDDLDYFMKEHRDQAVLQAYIVWGVLDYRPTKTSKTRAEKMLVEDLPEPEALLLRARLESYPTLYRVASHQTKTGTVDLNDVLLGGTVTVHDQLMSENIANGVFVSARVFKAGNFHFLDVVGPPLGAGMGLEAAEFLRDCGMEFTPAGLRREAHMFGWLWRWIDEWQANWKPPRLCNTDGDDLLWHTVSFSVANLAETRQTLLVRPDIQHDDPEDEFLWVKKIGRGAKMLGGPVTLGRIEFVGDELVLTVNSAKRFAAARKWLEKLPGVVYRDVATRRLDGPEKDRPLDERISKPEPVEITPAMASAVQEMMNQQYMEWLDEPLPILGGQTPREACRTASGRQQVTMLIRTTPDPMGDAPVRVPRDALLRELGLAAELLTASLLPLPSTSPPFKSDEEITPGRKIGRNEPCPCGSGKKYKKCCGK